VGLDAHLSTKNVHVSRRRGAAGYPDGTVVVKAGRTGGELTLVAVMRKVAGADPAHGDWRFVEYKRPSASGPFRTDASLTGATCWSCHVTAEGTDWVFTQPG
jgi:Cytochrome P460